MELIAHVTLADVGVIAAALIAGVVVGVAATMRFLRRQDTRRTHSG